MRIKTKVLWAVMIAALCAGVWFIASPSLNRQADLDQQDELLDGIIALMPAYAVVESEIEIPASEYETVSSDGGDYANDDNTLPIIEYEPFEPEMLPSDEPIYEPLNQADFPSGIIPIGIITIDSIDLRLPVMEGMDEQKLKIAPGRVPQTADVGEIGNAVIVGHRNYTFGSMFNRLDEVENGEMIEFQAMSGEIMVFEVFEILEILPDDQIAFIQPQDESIITLYTCTPVRVATHRLLVRAKKI
jgi:LPXTG-site transpeptidase (sortase) family protein